VLDVHQSYVRAGADVLETNTFGANRFKLSTFGLADELRNINVEGARIAKRAARDHAWVAGSMGPLGVRIEPWGKTGVDDAEAAFREQAEALAEGGVDLFMLETFRDVNELAAAVRAIRSVSALPIVAQMTTEDDGNSLDGTPPETFAPRLEAAGADVIGVNCSVGPAAMLETLERMSRATAKPLAAQPNAGRPRDVDGRNLYLCSPDYMATYARRFIDAGAHLVGGCCGTTPEHIRQIKQAVKKTTSGVVFPKTTSGVVLDHLGIAVADSTAMQAFFKDHFGLATSELEDIGLHRLRFVESGDATLELVEPLGADAPIAKFIAKRGEGLHHVCLRVKDIEKTMADLKAKGVEFIDDRPRQGAHGSRIAFIKPASANGLLVEIKQTRSAQP